MSNFLQKKVILTPWYLDVLYDLELNKLYFFGRIFYTFTTLAPPVEPRTQKIFCNFGQKNIFFEDLIFRRFRKFGIE